MQFSKNETEVFIFWDIAMDRLRAMSVFIAIADTGSLTAAARRLSLTATTVSRLLSDLEAHLSVELAVRTPRQMTLTDEGRTYLELARRVIDDVESTEARMAGVKGELSGELVITAPIVFGRLYVLPLIQSFLAEHKDIQVRLLLSDSYLDLTDDVVDVAIRIGHLADSSLIATKVGAVHRCWCASPDYLARRGMPKSPDDIAEHDCILFTYADARARWQFRSRQFGRRAVRIAPRLTVSTAEAAIDSAVAGMGIVKVLSYQVENALSEGQLERVLAIYDDHEIPVNVVHRPFRARRPHIIEFLTFATTALKQALRTREKRAPADVVKHNEMVKRTTKSPRAKRTSGGTAHGGTADASAQNKSPARRRSRSAAGQASRE